MEWVPRLCQAYAYQRALGHDGVASELALHVMDRSHPDSRAANHCSRVRARQPRQIDALLAEVERVFAHCAHRVFLCDPTTPPEFVARLMLEGYRCETPTVLLRLAEPARLAAPESQPPGSQVRDDLGFEPVADVGTWHRLAALVRMGCAEGVESGFMQVPDRMVDSRIDAYRRKAPSYRFFLLTANGHDHGYGAAVTCPNRMGLLDDLYIPREYRRRGFATALIRHLVAHVREEGAHDVMLGAPLDSGALGLYQKLGFVPTCLIHSFEKQRAQ